MSAGAILAVWIDVDGRRHVERVTECLCTRRVTCLSHRQLARIMEQAVAMVLVPLLKVAPLPADNYITAGTDPAGGGDAG